MNNKNYKQILMFSQVKLIRAFIIFNAFSFYTGNVYSQATVGAGSGGTSSNLMPVIASPNVAAFQKYGDLPVNHNTGVPQIQVPVYTISLNGFSWPISLSYHAGGFKSEDVATRTGLGWTLMGGGVISTKESLFDGTNYELTGDLDLGNYVNPLATSECSYNNPSDIDIADRIASGIYKVRPDAYYINAGSLNGKFILDGGNTFMLPATDYKIISNGLVSGGYGHTGWTVYDNSGNKYEFLARGETSRTSSCQGWANMIVNVSYFLTKITTANNETITFTYDTETYSYNGPKLHIVKSLMPGQLASCNGAVSPEDYYCDNSVGIEEKRLKKIIVSNGTEIDFTYSSRTDLPGSMKLDRIKVAESRNSVLTDIKDTYLNYSYFGTGSNPDNLQLKLNTVDFKDINSSFRNNYRFTYNTNPLPSKTSGSYWDGVYTISEAGLLEKLEYPTGGYTVFAYDVLPDYGAARIKEIKDYASANAVSGFRRFEYGLPSAGNFPRQEYEQYYYLGNPANGNPMTCEEAHATGAQMTLFSCMRTVKKSTPVIDMPAELRGTEITYGNIIEYYGRNGENGKIEYTYGAPDISGRNPIDVFYLQNPLYLTQKKVYKKNGNGSYSIVSNLENEYTVPATGNVFWSSKIFSSRVFLVKVLRPELTISCTGPGGVPYSGCFPKQYWTNDFKVTSLPVFLKKSTEETYSETDKLTNVIDYYYENAAHLNPTKVETKNSKNQVIETTTKYPYDFLGTAVYDGMISKNMITPVETIVRNATLSKELSRQKVNFSFWYSNTLIAPGSVQQSIGGNSLETETTVNSYTTNGRIKEIVGRDGVITSYFWGYGDQYPVAKVTGRSYNDAVSASSIVLSMLNNSSSESSLRTETNKLRSVSGAFVTSYTYKPLIGMSSITDVNNNTSYYEYDGYNRLSLVRDKDNNIFKKFCYNFYGQVENCSGQSTNPVWMPNGVTRCKVCPTNSSFYLPMVETQEIDINPLSGTYGSPPRWVDYRYDESCMAGTDWITDNTIAPYCQQQSGNNTSFKVITEKNINPCSPYYTQTRPRLQLDCSTCPKLAVWMATGYKICEMSGSNFTGNVLREEINTIDCSTVPLNAIRYVFDSYNPTVCSVTGCNNVTCTGEGYKCVNNVCEQGIKVYTASNLVDPENWIYSCVYHYEFSDNTWSADYNEMSYVPCL